ncbi:MAG TPA: caspase family protein [Thermoanaerobaculia bacterium]|nr:caspase family protein [Thermoanaerobaculia bacterium]
MSPSSPSRPTSAAAFEHGYAVVIGVAGYRARALSPLPLPALNDAVDLARSLWDPEICGYRADRVRLLLDEQATADGIRQALAWMSEETYKDGKEATAIAFFSGHGWRDESGTYLAAYDADTDTPLAGMISGDELATRLQAIGAGRLAVFLDCCHAGGAGEIRAAKRGHGALGSTVASDLYERTYQRLSKGYGRVLIASSGPDEESTILPDQRNSLFTSCLLRGLAGEAKGTDPAALGIFDLYQFASAEVQRLSLFRQTPLFKGQLQDNFAVALRREEPPRHKIEPPPRGRSAPAADQQVTNISGRDFDNLTVNNNITQ